MREQTEQLLQKLNNMPLLTWEEQDTGIRFEATIMDIAAAMYGLNQYFSMGGEATLHDFFSYFSVDYSKYPQPDYIFSTGWSMCCYEGYDAPWIDYDIGHHIEKDGSVIFEIRFIRSPCASMYECLGYGPFCDDLE